MYGGFVAILLATGVMVFYFALIYAKQKTLWMIASAVILLLGVVMGLSWTWSRTDCCFGIFFLLAWFYAMGVIGLTWQRIRQV